MFNIEIWLPFIVGKSHQITFSWMKAAVEKYDLTPPQFATLSFLQKRDGINQQELGALMWVDRTTIGGIVDRLEKLNYVKREPDQNDHRSYIISVTNKGAAIHKEAVASINQVITAINNRLSEGEQAQLIGLLNKLRGITP